MNTPGSQRPSLEAEVSAIQADLDTIWRILSSLAVRTERAIRIARGEVIPVTLMTDAELRRAE